MDENQKFLMLAFTRGSGLTILRGRPGAVPQILVLPAAHGPTAWAANVCSKSLRNCKKIIDPPVLCARGIYLNDIRIRLNTGCGYGGCQCHKPAC